MNTVVHHARPVTDGEQQTLYRETLSFAAETKRFRGSFNRLGWVAGGIGMACMAASAIGWDIMLPLKTTELRFIVDDHEHGTITYAMNAADAPSLFGTKEAEHYLMQYVDKREGYVPEMDKHSWDIVQVMSSSDVFEQYIAWRKSDLSPVKQLGTYGHVLISHFAFTPHGNGKNGTYEYTVRYDRQEVRPDNIGPIRSWSGTIDFQWHPKTSMTTQEKLDNPGGMVIIAYSPPEPDR